MAAIRRAAIFNGAAPGANTDILSDSITPTQGCVFARVAMCTSTATIIKLTASDGTTTHSIVLTANPGTATSPANTLYKFEFGVDPALSYNVQVGTDSVIEQLLWDDILERG